MKHLFLALVVALLGTVVAITDAEAARRFGGGRSSGLQRDMQRNITPPAAPSRNAATGAPQQQPQNAGARRWLGPLAGLAAGIGLAALLSHFGLGEGFASIVMLLLLVLAAVFVFRLLFRRSQPQGLGYAGAGGPGAARFEALGSGPAGTAAADGAAAPASVPGDARIPAGFDAQGFLRQAKLNFIRLQAANDARNLDDMRDFTSPEMFAEISLQMQERDSAPQHTEVVTLDGEVLEVTEENARYVASVRFHGTIREEEAGAPQPFDEVWHLTKPTDGSRGWVVAGIQQTA